MRKYYVISTTCLLSFFFIGAFTFYISDWTFFINLNQPIQEEFNLGVLLKIFINNFTIVVILFLGYFSFGILPLITIIFNGFMLGGIFAEYFYLGISFLDLLKGTFAHIFIEFIAFIIAGAWGIYGISAIKVPEKILENLTSNFGSLRRAFLTSFILILIAAIFEYFISAKFLELW